MTRTFTALMLVLGIAVVCTAQVKEKEKAAPEKARPKKAKGYAVGDVVADFTLPDVNDKKHKLTELAKGARLIVLDFWSWRCPYCVGSEERYVKLHEKYGKKGVVFVHINSNRTENRTRKGIEKTKAVIKKEGIRFPVLIDKDNKIADVFGAKVTPTVFILDASTRKVLYTGAPNDNPLDADNASRDFIEETVKAVLAGKKIKTPSTRAKG